MLTWVVHMIAFPDPFLSEDAVPGSIVCSLSLSRSCLGLEALLLCWLRPTFIMQLFRDLCEVLKTVSGNTFRRSVSNVFRRGGREAVNAPTNTSEIAKMLRLTEVYVGSGDSLSDFIS